MLHNNYCNPKPEFQKIVADIPKQRAELDEAFRNNEISKLNDAEREELYSFYTDQFTILERSLFEEIGRINGRLELWRAVPTFDFHPLQV